MIMYCEYFTQSNQKDNHAANVVCELQKWVISPLWGRVSSFSIYPPTCLARSKIMIQREERQPIIRRCSSSHQQATLQKADDPCPPAIKYYYTSVPFSSSTIKISVPFPSSISLVPRGSIPTRKCMHVYDNASV